MAFGYVLANEKSKVIVLHDCDILSYDREFLARLCYAVVNPNLGYEFCKGYYARVTNKMHGRVTRLFVTPPYLVAGANFRAPSFFRSTWTASVIPWPESFR